MHISISNSLSSRLSWNLNNPPYYCQHRNVLHSKSDIHRKGATQATKSGFIQWFHCLSHCRKRNYLPCAPTSAQLLCQISHWYFHKRLQQAQSVSNPSYSPTDHLVSAVTSSVPRWFCHLLPFQLAVTTSSRQGKWHLSPEASQSRTTLWLHTPNPDLLPCVNWTLLCPVLRWQVWHKATNSYNLSSLTAIIA